MAGPYTQNRSGSSTVWAVIRNPGRLQMDHCGIQNFDGLTSELETELSPRYSKRLDFSPAQPRRAKTRLPAGKAAASEGPRRYRPHFVGLSPLEYI